MKYFEEGHIYSYDEIKDILEKAQVVCMADLCKSQNMLDDSELEMVLTLHMMSVLYAYKVLLLKGKENE